MRSGKAAGFEQLGRHFIRIRGSVKTRAHALMQEREQPDVIDVETIRAALQA